MGESTCIESGASGAIDYYPTYLPVDTTDGDCTTGTAYAIHVSYSGLNPVDTYLVKAYQYRVSVPDNKGCMWNWQTTKWVAIDNNYPATLPTISGVTIWSTWIFLKDVTTHIGAGDLRLIVRLHSATDDDALVSSGLTAMDMTTNGGWLEETASPVRAGKAILVRDGSNIIGLYIAKSNNVNDGYVYGPGGFKVSVPACVSCNYTIAAVDQTAPGTIVGSTNKMGQDGCPSDVPAGTTVSLDVCNHPTVISLRSLSAQNGWSVTLTALVAVLVLFFGGGRTTFNCGH